MANEAKQLLQQGIAAAKNGQNEEARRLLQDAVKRDPKSEQAWLWLSSVAVDDKERIFCLKQILKVNPNNDNAIKGLKQLGVEVAPPADSPPSTIRSLKTLPKVQPLGAPPPPESKPSSRSSAPIDDFEFPDYMDEIAPSGKRTTGTSNSPRTTGLHSALSGQPGVPMPDDVRITSAISQVETVLQRYIPIPTVDLPYQWTKKRRGRVGDSSAAILRAGVVGVVTVIAVALIGGLGFLLTRPGGASNIVAIFNSPTPTPIPTQTFTPTPGVTDTPSATPAQPIPPSDTPDSKYKRGDVFNIVPTEVNPKISNFLLGGIDAANRGDFTKAFEIIDQEVKANSAAKQRDYYVAIGYLAYAHLLNKNPDRALAILDENKNDEIAFLSAVRSVALYDKGRYDEALADAVKATNAERNLTMANLIGAKVAVIKNDFDSAQRFLNFIAEYDPDNEEMLVGLAEVALARGDFAESEKQALLAVYVNPLNRKAYLIRIEALLLAASKQPDQASRIQGYGKAVLATKDYLLYYQADAIGWRLLGDARRGEGNFDAAYLAYAQGFTVVAKNSPEMLQLYNARGSLYLSQNFYSQAYDDFNAAILIDGGNTTAIEGRLAASVALGEYKTANDDASKLLQSSPTNTVLVLTQAELWVRTEQYDQVVQLITNPFINRLPKEQQATARLYKGIATFKTSENPKQGRGLDDITLSLREQDSALGRYYRGQIYEAQSNYSDALADYEWLAYWNQYYKYAFMEDVNSRIEQLKAQVSTFAPTATLRNSYTPSRTPSPTLTRTPRPTRTPTITPTFAETLTPSPTETVEITITPTSDGSIVTETPVETLSVTATETPVETLSVTATETPTADGSTTPSGDITATVEITPSAAFTLTPSPTVSDIAAD